MIKWHFPHSIHSGHRGKTHKCPIANHRVEYNYGKVIPISIAVDRNNNLTECFIEFEVLQLFNTNGTVNGNGPAPVREEKTTLGIVRLNLAEYVEESESILRDGIGTGISPFLGSPGGPAAADFRFGHNRNRSSLSAVTPAQQADGNSPRYLRPSAEEEKEQERPMTAMTTKTFATTATMTPAEDVQDGVVRRYLMQESKINSTLKISILMIQVEGERNFIAPPLKTAPVFGGIAGLMAGDMLDPNADAHNATRTHPHHAAAGLALGELPSLSHKSRDVFELQDCYRRVLAASWESQPGELTADQCIEDIFSGGDGFRTDMGSAANTPSPISRGRGGYKNNVNSNFADGSRSGHRKKHSFGGRHEHGHFRASSGQYYRDQRDKLAAAISIGLGGVPVVPTTPGANNGNTYRTPSAGSSRSRHLRRRDEPTSGSASGDEDSGSNGNNNRDTLRPSTAVPTTSSGQGSMARIRQHIRHHSGTSDKSIRTVMAEQQQQQQHQLVPEEVAADKAIDNWYNINNYGFSRGDPAAAMDDAQNLKNLLNSLNNKPNNLNTRPATSTATMNSTTTTTPTTAANHNAVNNINTSLNNGLSPAFRDLGKMLSSAAPPVIPSPFSAGAGAGSGYLNSPFQQNHDAASMGVVITDGDNNSYESNIGRMGFGGGGRGRSDSLASLATLSIGSEAGSGSGSGGYRYGGYKKAREVDEFEVREDLVAWTIPARG